MNQAVINSKNIVINVLVVDDISFMDHYQLGLGEYLIGYTGESENVLARIGEVYIDNKFMSIDLALGLGYITADEFTALSMEPDIYRMPHIPQTVLTEVIPVTIIE